MPVNHPSRTPNREELLAYILSFRPGHQECREYYASHMNRVMMRLEYLDGVDRSSRILEIGAGPFNTTLVLRKIGFTDIECTNYDEDIGNRPQEVSSGEMKLYSPDLDEWQVFKVNTFDVERDAWPYGDESFDMVMGFEILEHFARDPMHALSEANRVTRPGGLIFLTTPNIVSIRNIILMLRMRAPGEHPAFRPAKAQGARHNREWTPREVSLLLHAAGFDILRLDTRQLAEPDRFFSLEHLIRSLQRLFPWRGDHIFALGRKAGGVRTRFPVEERIYYQWDEDVNRRMLEKRMGRSAPDSGG